MESIYRRAFFVLAIAALPGIAAAEDAFTLRPTDIYAGPDSGYPMIAQLPPNTEVGVAGCLSDWSWCDVTFANDRGWVWAGDLGYPYEGRRVAIVEFGPRLHIPAVTFSLNSYWDAHYHSRPFFREREQWAGRVHVEANRGGRPPHGGASVAERGSRSRSAPSAQSLQRSGEQAQGEARSHEQAQRAQPTQPQAARTPAEQHAQSSEPPAGRMAQARPEREARTAQESARSSRGESERGSAKGEQRREQTKEQTKEERKEGTQQ